MAFGRDRDVMSARAQVAAPTTDMSVDAGLRAYMLSVYNYMCTGLAVSGFVALGVHATPVGELFYVTTPEGVRAGFNMLGMIAVFSPLALLLFAMFAGARMSVTATQGLYWAIVALNGVSLSILLEVYTGTSVVKVFFITAAAFASLSLWGYTTKRDLSGFGSFLIMGLFGLIIASVVNIFLGSSMMEFIIAAAGVLIFAGLTAYDTQRIKLMYYETGGVGEVAAKGAVWAALSLYLDFINLLQFLLYFLGNRE